MKMNSNGMTTMCDDYDDDSDDMEGNDDEFGALGSILSWDEAEEGAVSRDAANMSSLLRDRGGNGSSGMSAPPDMVQFDTKDGVPQFSFLQRGGLSNQFSMNSSGQITSSNGNLTMQLPLPTPISSFGQQEHHHQSIVQSQANQAVQQQTQMSQQANVSQTSQQQQQPTQQQQSTQQQQQAQQFVAQNAANFAQFFAQQAGNLMQQQSNAARQQQSQPVPLQPSLPPIQQQMQQAQPPQQQTQQAQLPFTSDPNTFLQQLQFAQLQQQFQAAQAQQQQQQLPNAMQQQLQAHFSQAQAAAAVTSNVPLASAPAPNATQAQPQHPKKQHKVSDGSKSASTRLPPKAKAVSNADIAMISLVSASDTDGEASRRVKSKKSAPSDMMIMAEPPLDMSNMTEAEKVKANRDRNREHARNTRLRKKAYLEKLKTTVDELCRERDSLVSERASTANLLVEMHNTRTEVLMSFFALRTANEKRRKLWSSILDESCFACVMPVTPYRSFPASEVQVSKCLRTIMGIDGMMADTASLRVLLDTLVDRSKYPYDKINFRYTLVTEEAVVAGNQMMARWVMTTTNAVLCGAKMEVTKQGMLCCKFNSAHKIIGLELMFDVMAFMLQLKQAAGSDGFSVIPNTVQTCQRSFDKPMVVTLAEPPYTIIQANQLWMDMTGYTAEDVVGKASCSILQSSDMEKKALKNMMQEIRYKRPASAMLVNTTKSGEIFSNFLVVFPLSTDSRITYFLGLTMYNKEGQPVEADQSKVAAVEALAQNNAVVTSGNIVQQATAAMLPPLMLGLAPQAQIDSVGVMPPPTTSNLSSILNEIPRSGSVLGGLKRPRETPSASVVLQR